MALFKVIEKHKVNILGQEIIYTNKFIKYKEGSNYSLKPSSSLISCSISLFKYEFEHPYLTPSLIIDSKGDKYIVPTWEKVHPETTLKDINVIRPIKKVETPIEKNSWKFESSSEKGLFYTVRQNGSKLTCTCSGFFRCRDKNIGCKHCQEVRSRMLKN